MPQHLLVPIAGNHHNRCGLFHTHSWIDQARLASAQLAQ